MKLKIGYQKRMKYLSKHLTRKKGFTLVELVIVMATTSILLLGVGSIVSSSINISTKGKIQNELDTKLREIEREINLLTTKSHSTRVSNYSLFGSGGISLENPEKDFSYSGEYANFEDYSDEEEITGKSYYYNSRENKIDVYIQLGKKGQYKQRVEKLKTLDVNIVEFKAKNVNMLDVAEFTLTIEKDGITRSRTFVEKSLNIY